MFFSDSSNCFTIIPPPYILYGRENRCMTHPQAYCSSLLCAVSFSALQYGGRSFCAYEMEGDATVEYYEYFTIVTRHCHNFFSAGTGSFLFLLVSVKCVSLLSSPDTLSCQDGWNSLMVASQSGHVEVVDKLLQHGATVDLKDQVITTHICRYYYNEIYNHMCLKLVIFHHHTIRL